MKIKRITILLITLIFTIFLVGCPGSREYEVLEPNELGFYDGYYVYKTEVYMDQYFDRTPNYNEDNKADGVTEYLSSDSYTFEACENIEEIEPFTMDPDGEIEFDFSMIEKAYYAFESPDAEATGKMLLIDKEKKLYWANGSFFYEGMTKPFLLFININLYERVIYSDNAIEACNQENSISIEDFLTSINQEDIASEYSFINSTFYNTFTDKIKYNEYFYYLRINNNFVFRIGEYGYETIAELLYIMDNKIIETIRDFNLFEAFLITNTHKLFMDTNEVKFNDIMGNINNDPSSIYYRFYNLEKLNTYFISRSLNEELLLIKENPVPGEVLDFIEILKELIFVKCEEDIKLNVYGMYNIGIDDNVLYMNIINGRYYMIVNESIYEIINPTIDFLNACYIFNDYRYW